MAAAVMQPDRAMLAQRIQGFGNVNPPPLEEENASNVAKRAVRNLGDMVGEEVALTVQDFKEKGAVGAVKDAVADAGDILIDGVSGIVGWFRGEPLEEEETDASKDAQKVLANGPRGAAYGVSQASPSGGINAVWVMPEEADPSTLAELARQPQTGNPAYAPSNIQPYQGPNRGNVPSMMPQMPQMPNMPQRLPNGIEIAPYQPNAFGPGRSAAPFTPGQFQGHAPFVPGGQFSGPGSFNPAYGGYGGQQQANTGSGPKGLIERVAKGDALPGKEVAGRLAQQCASSKVSATQLAEHVADRVRRLYLGLDNEGDEGILRMLQLVDAMKTQESAMMNEAVAKVKDSVKEELLSLNSSTKHKERAARDGKRR
ncbi:unnamed protein product [Effrenium voratum]|nr:unnamed protein product [Effrenium voratum]CAJ1445720.1 unnamed protein product [Effrenium voratum]